MFLGAVVPMNLSSANLPYDREANRNFFLNLSQPAQTGVRPILGDLLPTKRIVEKIKLAPSTDQSNLKKASEPKEYVVERPKYLFVIAPHPDDEILCCSTIIKQKREEGYLVKVIYLTHGDGLSPENHQQSIAYGETRRIESLMATSKLGINRDDTIWLNFPDGQLTELDENILTSKYTGQSQTNETSLFPGKSYTETDLIQIIDTLFTWYEPSIVYLPHPRQDTHPDHRYASQLTLNVLNDKNLDPETFTYKVHGIKSWEKQFLPKADADKMELIELFKSQFHDKHHAGFLREFAWIKERLKRYKL